MRLIDDSRDLLPAALTDGISTHYLGLRRARLFRVQGQRGAVRLSQARWDFEACEGDPPEHGQAPDDDEEDIAQKIHERALEAISEGGKERRFKLELTTAREGGGEETETIGFQVDEHATTATTATTKPTDAIDSLSRYIDKLHTQNVRLLEGQAKSYRAVFGALPQLLHLRFDAFEDRIQAAYDREGIEPAADTSWRGDTLKDLKELALAIAPALTGKDAAPSESLRGQLQALGESLSKEQRTKLVGIAGLETAGKLKAAGSAEDDKAAAALLAEVIRDIDGEQLEAMLTEPQRKMLDAALSTFETIAKQHAENG